MQIVAGVVVAKQCLKVQICTSFVFLDAMCNGKLWSVIVLFVFVLCFLCKTTCSSAKPDSAFKLKGFYVIGHIKGVKKLAEFQIWLEVQALLISAQSQITWYIHFSASSFDLCFTIIIISITHPEHSPRQNIFSLKLCCRGSVRLSTSTRTHNANSSPNSNTGKEEDSVKQYS